MTLAADCRVFFEHVKLLGWIFYVQPLALLTTGDLMQMPMSCQVPQCQAIAKALLGKTDSTESTDTDLQLEATSVRLGWLLTSGCHVQQRSHMKSRKFQWPMQSTTL